MEKVKNNVYSREAINIIAHKVPEIGTRVLGIKERYVNELLCKFGYVTGIVQSISYISENKYEIVTKDEKKYILQINNYFA